MTNVYIAILNNVCERMSDFLYLCFPCLRKKQQRVLPNGELRKIRDDVSSQGYSSQGYSFGTTSWASGDPRSPSRATVTDWSELVLNGTHYWYEYDGSSMCALTTSDKDCKSVGNRKPKVKCTACRIVLHDECREDLTMKCRPTFRDANHKKESWTQHHWVLRRKTHGAKCKECNKTLPKGPTWASNRNNKAFIAVSCSWCKDIYHTSCFKLSLIEDHCSLGDFEQIIIPPNWIVFGSKARSGGSKKGGSKRKISYSTRPSSSSKRTSQRKRLSEHDRESFKPKCPFHIKVPSSVPPSKTPLLVFVNPKSGGNQGAYLIRAFQWYLNPRQVFDITDGGPKLPLLLFQSVPNLRILVCGGDGTVGWVLSEIDNLNFIQSPPVAVLPLGTGNDLARVLNWGGGYNGEPIDRILYHVADGRIQSLDRWEIDVESMDNADTSPTNPMSPTTSSMDEVDANSKSKEVEDPPQKELPINIMNNYFSLGLDAYIQYQFHTGREAKPEKYSSRAYNKFVYVKGGVVDTFERKYKSLTAFIELMCDGEDFTDAIKDHKIHCLVFLNIKSYSAGTNPWGSHLHSGGRMQAMDDGYLEVVGLFSAPTMAALQVGITGVRICQCREVSVITRKPIHCQVDGEPLYLAPSIIRISRRNQVRMVVKGKTRHHMNPANNPESSTCSVEPVSFSESAQPIKLAIHKITYSDFNQQNGNMEKLQKLALPLTMVVVRPTLGIDSVRPYVEKCVKDIKDVSTLPGCVSENWVFLDCSNGRFYPISNDLEGQLPVLDMVATGIFVLDMGPKGTPKTPKNSRDTVDMTGSQGSQDDNSSESSFSRQNKRMTPPSSGTASNNFVHSDKEIDETLTELFASLKSGELDKVKCLKTDQVDVAKVTDDDGLTPLHLAVKHRHQHLVKHLLSLYSPDDINSHSKHKQYTALHFAAENNDTEMCGMLIESGAKVSTRDNEGRTTTEITTDTQTKEFLSSHDSGTPV